MVLDGTVVSIYYDDTTVSEIACMAIYGIIVVQCPESSVQRPESLSDIFLLALKTSEHVTFISRDLFSFYLH